MNKSSILAVFFFLFTCQFLLAQDVNVHIIEGFKNGKASELASQLAPVVDYIGPKKEGQLNGSQTISQLTSFFSAHKASNFIIKHSGDSPSGNVYSIGVLTTNDGDYRVYLLFAANSNNKISEIRIEKDE